MILLSSLQGSRLLHTELLKRRIRAPINLFYDRVPLGRFINRFTSDLEGLDTSMPLQLGGVLHSPINLLARFVVCAVTGTIWVFPLALIFMFVGFKIQQKYL